MSKGDKYRPVDQKKYAENYDRIFRSDPMDNHVYEIDDGETHWIVAASEKESVQLLIDSLMPGEYDADKYIEEFNPDIMIYQKEYLELRITEELNYPTNYPSGSEYYVRIPKTKFKELPKGLIGSTIY